MVVVFEYFMVYTILDKVAKVELRYFNYFGKKKKKKKTVIVIIY